MGACHFYGTTTERHHALNLVPAGSATCALSTVRNDGTREEAGERRFPARIVVLAPVLGACLWVALIHGIYTSF